MKDDKCLTNTELGFQHSRWNNKNWINPRGKFFFALFQPISVEKERKESLYLTLL